MHETISAAEITAALRRAGRTLVAHSDYLTTLDQAIGDGDMGITMGRIGAALLTFVDTAAADDIGQYLAQAGMAANKAGPSTMGTLLATALMRAGKSARGKSSLAPGDLAAMFVAADEGIAERGKAQLGEKTVRDALQPASMAFASAVAAGAPLPAAYAQALAAAEAGRDRVTPMRSMIGRAEWVGERTEGKVDPGCEMCVLVLKALAE